MTATNPHIEPFVAAMRDMSEHDRDSYALACIRKFATGSHRTDADVADGVRDVLAALEIVTRGEARPVPAPYQPDTCPYTQSHTREFCGYATCREA